MRKTQIYRITGGWIAVILTAVLFIFCFLFTLQFEENRSVSDRVFNEIFFSACLGAVTATIAFFSLSGRSKEVKGRASLSRRLPVLL